MYKKIIFEISDFDLNNKFNLKGKFWHEWNAPTPTGIKAILEGFYFNKEEIDTNKAKEIILDKLIEINEINSKKGWKVSFEPSHSWSTFDDDGYASSIYRVDVEVYQIIH